MSDSVMIGQTLSHYTIVEKLGEGGMGVVYKAEDTKLGRPVALKFLSLHVNPTNQDKARFLQEAKAAAALNHPNIGSVIDVQEHDKQMFIVMEFVEGQTLKDKMRVLSLKQAIEIGIQIADGLAAAHEKGVVHRDIKPENIMVRKDGIAQIMDFGLAKLRGVSRLTREGSAVGTAGYMSPEQVQGHDVDHRSDIFSLGVLLYEMFAGGPPFKGVHEAAMAYEIVSVDPPPLSGLKPGIDPELNRIVMECLQKDPADRFQSAAEVAKELRRVKRASDLFQIQHSRNSSGENRRHLASVPGVAVSAGGRRVLRLALGACVVGVSAVALLLWRPWETKAFRDQPVGRFDLAFPGGSSLDFMRDGLALSPDGKHLALIVRKDSSSRLFIRDMDQFEMRPVAAASGLDISGVFFSPDGQWLGFFANGKMMKLSLGGGTPVTICDALPGEASWGEGGDIVFMQNWGSGLWIVSSEAGSVARPLTKLNPEAGERAHLLPCVLPGGSEALFSIWRGGAFQDNLIAIADLKTGDHRTILRGGSAPCYLKTGQIIFMRGSTLMASPFDARDLKVTGEPLPMLEKVLTNGSDAHAYFTVSDNGTLVYAEGGVEYLQTTITLVGSGMKSRRIESRGANFGFPFFSPDGNRLAVVIFGTVFQIGVYDLRRNTLTPLTFTADNVGPVWLPDGSQITFISNMDGRYQIYTTAADGGGTPQKLLDQGGAPPPPPRAYTWTRDAKNMAYVTFHKETGADIWLYSRVDTPSTRSLIATRANESNPSFSPDGHWIAYVSDESGTNEIYIQPFPPSGGRWRVSTSGGYAPVWSPDGRRILFERNDEIVSASVMPGGAKHGQTIVIGSEETFLVRKGLISFDLSPDGRSVVIGQTSTKASVGHINVVVNWSEELKEKLKSQEASVSR